MAEKRPAERTVENTVVCAVKDMGVAAYLKMLGYRLLTRRGREFDFEVEESKQDAFKQDQVEYVNSQYAIFDAEIMNLKKLPDR